MLREPVIAPMADAQPPQRSPGTGDASVGQGGGKSPQPEPDSAADAGASPDPQRRSRAERVCGTALGRPQTFPATLRAERIRDGFGFLEGPVWLREQGVLVFSDMNFQAPDEAGPPSRIRRFRPPSSFDVFVEESNSNGLALDTDGSLLGCTHDVQSLSRFDTATGARTVLPLTFMGHHFNSPNDLVVRSDRNVYFTDPDWQLGQRSSETGTTGVYRVTPGGEVLLVSDRLEKPNGIALSLDERTLYVGSAGADVFAYPLDGSGAVGDAKRFASPGASDGMTLDCAGNLYVTAGDSVRVFDPSGAELTRIQVEEQPTNVAFGGSNGRTLYVTAGSGLYSLTLGSPGLPY